MTFDILLKRETKMSIRAEVYRHSGKMGSSLIWAPVIGLAGAILFSMAYAYIIVYSPFVLITLFATIMFGLFTGGLTGITAEACRSRNPIMVGGLGLMTGMAALYFSWGFFLHVFFSKCSPDWDGGLFTLVADPLALLYLVEKLNEVGWFRVNSTSEPISGSLLMACWGIEACTIVGVSVYAAYISISNKVFCETCNEWCEEKNDVARSVVPFEGAKAAIVSGDLGPMLEAEVPLGDSKNYLRLDHQICKKCGNVGTFQVVEFTAKADKNGKEETNEKKLTGNYLLSPDTVQQLGKLMSRGNTRELVNPEAPAIEEGNQAESTTASDQTGNGAPAPESNESAGLNTPS